MARAAYGADWVTVTVWPATVSVPVRAGPLLAAIETVTLPFPVPLLPAVMVMNDALLVAVHVDVQLVVTLITPVPPLASTLALVGETVNEHADCVMGNA
jgi:hypothetical protein